MSTRNSALFEAPLPHMLQERSNAYAYKYAHTLPWATETDAGPSGRGQRAPKRHPSPAMPIHASRGPNLLDDSQVTAAVERNRHFATQLWKGLRTPICIYYLRFYQGLPDEAEFAQAVARWQHAVGGLHVNGQLDATTWHVMRTRGEPHQFTTPEGLVRPSNFHEVITTFGDPRQNNATWERKNIVRIHAPSGNTFRLLTGGTSSTIRGHRLLQPHFEHLFETIATLGLWDAIQPVSGPYAFRNVRGGNQLSMHAFGIAIDIRPSEYARGQKASFPGPDVVHVFQDYGFHWGIFWHTPDPMHFQFAIGA